MPVQKNHHIIIIIITQLGAEKYVLGIVFPNNENGYHQQMIPNDEPPKTTQTIKQWKD